MCVCMFVCVAVNDRWWGCHCGAVAGFNRVHQAFRLFVERRASNTPLRSKVSNLNYEELDGGGVLDDGW